MTDQEPPEVDEQRRNHAPVRRRRQSRGTRTFFFGSYQGTRIRNLQGGLSAFVPTSANIAGEFSSLLNASDPNNPQRRAIALKDPVGGQPFPGNIIPASRFDPASVGMLKYL